MRLWVVFFNIFIFFLGGCINKPSPTNTNYYKNSEVVLGDNFNYQFFKTWQVPYRVNGLKYYPIEGYTYYDEVGFASVYTTKHVQNLGEFNNSLGEIFDDNIPCAAHRTLPLPSIVLVSTLIPTITPYDRVYKIRHCMVLVLDRGPFAVTHKRVIDLSKSAAKSLGIDVKNGIFPVRVTALPEAGVAYSKFYRQFIKNNAQNKKNHVKMSQGKIYGLLEWLKKTKFGVMPYEQFRSQYKL